jgi:hypothetical protein
MDDPLVGGYTPARVALRRAIAPGHGRGARDLRVHPPQPGRARAVDGRAAHHRLRPGLQERDGDHDPARAKALLDLHGYVDRNGDGWREQPDGKPLVLEVATAARPGSAGSSTSCEEEHGAHRHPREVLPASGPSSSRPRARASSCSGRWVLGLGRGRPRPWRGCAAAGRQPGPRALQERGVRPHLPAHAADRRRRPERDELFRQAKLIATAYMPYKATVHRFSNDLVQPWLAGLPPGRCSGMSGGTWWTSTTAAGRRSSPTAR